MCSSDLGGHAHAHAVIVIVAIVMIVIVLMIVVMGGLAVTGVIVMPTLVVLVPLARGRVMNVIARLGSGHREFLSCRRAATAVVQLRFTRSAPEPDRASGRAGRHRCDAIPACAHEPR